MKCQTHISGQFVARLITVTGTGLLFFHLLWTYGLLYLKVVDQRTVGYDFLGKLPATTAIYPVCQSECAFTQFAQPWLGISSELQAPHSAASPKSNDNYSKFDLKLYFMLMN